ncbi:transcriptional regulator [Mycolicibacterium phlei]|jgi:AcrR family transcriptional regulator|uniref:TetR family transcriptional regulator n=1 Tax=Mycolicibacterium phlei DSM 43239 = CCUG 21000 TaxID=1226750 RepID=A0A5N5V0B7_MYCPH|nr:TetR/AcrR family transcriptional regulator [Mycolicibacterium phlei]VEG10306.1 transcriptional regulator [Mycobacteroides chelonae]AMO62201.1 Bacterial regulatory protein, tetR family [Mycolicibacterium phlei]EID18355.1 TetR family transcriptional regulator [Mycolicibacterium phlei RIVM601174]KAB7755314.1 TetR family transcriptional regulator [Mycolicibacterium phlei DSM 43239 = CCUG 21000]KXW64818.1 TetR family transcriptional regulator [Mycolicibacterium phlei DSM 43239 = CCUG 21000]
MSSIRNDERTVEDRVLEAAAACVLAVGVKRVTMTDIARRARMSRPTIYRRWSDINGVLGALMTSRIAGVLDQIPDLGMDREALVQRVVLVAERLRNDEVVMSVLRDAPEFAMVYIADRLGTSQLIFVDALADAIRAGQVEGSVRAGDAQQMAAMCLLITQSTVQSAQMVEKFLNRDALNAELGRALNGYLAP